MSLFDDPNEVKSIQQVFGILEDATALDDFEKIGMAWDRLDGTQFGEGFPNEVFEKADAEDKELDDFRDDVALFKEVFSIRLDRILDNGPIQPEND